MDARAIVRRMVYQDLYGANYIFMSAYDGRMLVQPFSPELEGSDQSKLQDIHGKYIIQSLIKAAQLNPGGSFVDYYYPPPNSTDPEQKISYVVGLPDINAYIGAGIYPSQAYRQQQSLMFLLGAISLALLGLLAALTVQTIRKVKQTSDSIIKQKFAEQNLTSVFNSTHDAILVHDQSGKIVAVNSAMLKMYNLSARDVDGLMVSDISAPTGEQRYVIEDIWSRVVSGEDLLFEWISIRPYDQTRLNVEVSLSRIVWNDSPFILAVVRDITDRIKIQADLQKNEWLLEHAQSLSHIGHFYYELSSRQLTWSKELFRIYGLEPQSVPPSDISFPNLTFDNGRGDNGQFQAGKALQEEKIATDYQIVRPDGEVRDLILVMDHVRNQENEVIAYAGAVQDVTERRKVANSLRTTTLNLETVLENIPFEIWGFDLEGKCTLQNRTALELWGSLLGKQVDEAGIGGDLKNDWADTNQRVLSGHGIEKLKTRVIDGNVQHIHSIVSPIIDSGSGDRWVGCEY